MHLQSQLRTCFAEHRLGLFDDVADNLSGVPSRSLLGVVGT